MKLKLFWKKTTKGVKNCWIWDYIVYGRPILSFITNCTKNHWIIYKYLVQFWLYDELCTARPQVTLFSVPEKNCVSWNQIALGQWNFLYNQPKFCIPRIFWNQLNIAYLTVAAFWNFLSKTYLRHISILLFRYL